MRRMRRLTISLTVLFILLASAALSYASVVTVDVKGRTVISDVSTLEAKRVLVRGEQVQTFVMNTTLVPQTFTLKVNGLSAESYDLYINGKFTSTKPAKELEAGIPLALNGRIVDDGMVNCLTDAKASIDAENKKLNAIEESEPKRVCGTLGQASGWCSSAMQADKTWRSLDIILAPSGMVLQKMASPTHHSDIETATVVTRACWLLQQARARMFHVINDPGLRNEAVVSMTPVAFTVSYTTKNGKPHIEAKVLNNCDLPISGNISMALPSGWKTTAKSLAFTDLKCGKTFAISFDLVAPSKRAVAPDAVPMAANISLTQDVFTANCKIRATAIR